MQLFIQMKNFFAAFCEKYKSKKIGNISKSHELFRSYIIQTEGSQKYNPGKYNDVNLLFDDKRNLMDTDWAELSEYIVINDVENKCYYVKSILDLRIYLIDYDDVEWICCRVCEKLYTKFKKGNEICVNNQHLNERILKTLVENNFNLEDAVIKISV